MATVMLFLQQTTGKTERHTHFCMPLEPVFTRDCGGRVHFTDEPTGALNSANGTAVLDVFSSLHENGQSIVMVTHDKKSALRGSRILYIKDGKIFGECNLGKYDPDNIERTESFEAFITEMGW